MAAPPTRPAPYVQSTKLTIPPPPPPPPPQLLVAPHPVPTMAPCGIHPPQTAAIPLFTPQAFPSHESPRWPHGSEASTQTCLSGTEKPGCAVTTTIGHSSEMGTQVGGGGDSAPSASKNLVVTVRTCCTVLKHDFIWRETVSFFFIFKIYMCAACSMRHGIRVYMCMCVHVCVYVCAHVCMWVRTDLCILVTQFEVWGSFQE